MQVQRPDLALPGRARERPPRDLTRFVTAEIQPWVRRWRLHHGVPGRPPGLSAPAGRPRGGAAGRPDAPAGRSRDRNREAQHDARSAPRPGRCEAARDPLLAAAAWPRSEIRTVRRLSVVILTAAWWRVEPSSRTTARPFSCCAESGWPAMCAVAKLQRRTRGCRPPVTARVSCAPAIRVRARCAPGRCTGTRVSSPSSCCQAAPPASCAARPELWAGAGPGSSSHAGGAAGGSSGAAVAVAAAQAQVQVQHAALPQPASRQACLLTAGAPRVRQPLPCSPARSATGWRKRIYGLRSILGECCTRCSTVLRMQAASSSM